MLCLKIILFLLYFSIQEMYSGEKHSGNSGAGVGDSVWPERLQGV